MAKQASIKNDEILKQVPQKIDYNEIAKINNKIDEEILQLENKIKYLKEKYGVNNDEAAIYLLGFLAGVRRSGPNVPEILPMVFLKDGKETCLRDADLLTDREVVYAISNLDKLEKIKKELEELHGRLNKSIGEVSDDGKFIKSYIKLNINKKTLDTLYDIFTNGYKDGYNKNSIQGAGYETTEIKKQPVLENELIKLPVTLADWFIYGSKPIYFDKKTGVTGTKEQLELIRKAAAKKEIEGNEELLLYILPVIGSVYAIIKDLKIIKEGSQEKTIKLGNLEFSEKDIGKGLLVLDIVFGWVDISFIIHLGAKTAIKTTGKELEAIIKKGGREITISNIEKEVLVKATQELNEKEMKIFLENMSKNPSKIAREIVEKAGGSTEKITKDILRDYLKESKAPTLGTIKKVELILSKSRFREYAPQIFFEELAKKMDRVSIKYLGQSIKQLGKKEKEIALRAVFSTLSTFDENAQKALAAYVEKSGWEKLIETINKEKDIIKGLQKILPEYKDAYTYAPLDDIIKTARDLGAIHAVFTFFQLIGEYMSEKKEEALRLEEFLRILSTTQNKDYRKEEIINSFLESYENK